MKTVTPDWVNESVLQRSHVDESRYHPRLLAVRTVVPVAATPVVEAVEVKQETSVPSSCSTPAALPLPAVPALKPDVPVAVSKSAPARPANSRQLAQQATAQRLKESVIGVNRQDLASELPTPAPLPTPPIVRPVIARQTLPLSLPPTVPLPRQVAPPRHIMRNIANNTGGENRMMKNSPRANSAKVRGSTVFILF